MKLDDFIKEAEKIGSEKKCKVRINDTVLLDAELSFERGLWFICQDIIPHDNIGPWANRRLGYKYALAIKGAISASEVKWIKPIKEKKLRIFKNPFFNADFGKESTILWGLRKGMGPLVPTPAFEPGRCAPGDIVVCKAHGCEAKILEVGENTVVLSENGDFHIAGHVNTFEEMKKYFYFKTNIKEEKKTPMWFDEMTKNLDTTAFLRNFDNVVGNSAIEKTLGGEVARGDKDRVAYLRKYKAYFKSDLEIKVNSLERKCFEFEGKKLVFKEDRIHNCFIELAHWVHEQLVPDVHKMQSESVNQFVAGDIACRECYYRGRKEGITKVGNYLTEQAIKIGLVEKA